LTSAEVVPKKGGKGFDIKHHVIVLAAMITVAVFSTCSSRADNDSFTRNSLYGIDTVILIEEFGDGGNLDRGDIDKKLS